MLFLFFPAGDFVKFGFTMASTTTILAWGYLNYKDAYEKASKYDGVSVQNDVLIPAQTG